MIYKIKKGRHSIKTNIFLIFCLFQVGNRMFRMINMDSSFWFKKRNNDDEDINKLFGFSYGYHLDNSIRIGWKPDFENVGTIKMYAFWHRNGNFDYKYLVSLQTDDNHFININVRKESTEIDINNVTYIVPFDRPSGFMTLFRYRLFPYFGGDNTAPHNMKVQIV